MQAASWRQPMIRQVGPRADAPGRGNAECLGHFIVWRVHPRRRRTLSSKFNLAKFGARKLGGAISRPLKPTGTKFLQRGGGLNLPRPWPPTREADRRLRQGGTILTRRALSLNKTQTMWTMPSSQPL